MGQAVHQAEQGAAGEGEGLCPSREEMPPVSSTRRPGGIPPCWILIHPKLPAVTKHG